ncbi:DUF974 domain-containing protein [Akanthomyces lecanii RCEF 1005]|uniref:DUF974 domain-containing protein n=1 Tax=Akanthomyces lecanii RCEF 1005 TaxID=1081108 RepID=A0A168G964_CORDF|nr:DUF974 domain-containing protein [Akanthomyces lecanii RCEF 1005]
MSHQRYLSHDPVKEPHSVSVKVLRLSCPSLVSQYPIEPPFKASTATTSSPSPPPLPASLAYRASAAPAATTNPSPFLLSPILNLPVSFGSAYVGETFSCTLCANNDLTADDTTKKTIRDVRIEAEMKTPGQGKAQRLELGPAATTTTTADTDADGGAVAVADLAPGGTLQKVVSFDLKEEGNHVLAVTVSYYEATETSGRTRTFRKLYQFICKASLIVRTKVGVLDPPAAAPRGKRRAGGASPPLRRWVLEAQLENCSDDTMQLDRVVMELEPGLAYRDCNWTTAPPRAEASKPVLHPGEVEQVCFVVEALSRAAQVARGADEEDAVDVLARAAEAGGPDARVLFGVLGIGWRGEMGNRGFLSTGKLGTRVVR